jgi:lipoprotein NlpD
LKLSTRVAADAGAACDCAVPDLQLTPPLARPASAALALVAALLAGCATSPTSAPVEARKPQVRAPGPSGTPAPVVSGAPIVAAQPADTPAAAPGPAVKPPPPGIENAGKPGYYTVKAGDTLTRIGLENGQGWRDIARWNGLENANLIEVGQVLRVVPPGVEPGAAVARPVAAAGSIETRPLGTPAAGASAPAASGAAPPPAPAVAPVAAPAREPEDDLGWVWPAAGPVATPFDEARNVKGLQIAGKAGDPVVAAADGRVVYAGSGLRGLGNLIIVKHNNTYLTAYAHNQTLLVREDQVVRRGQKIAEMGSTEAERVQLHFEIRRQGKPIDPARLLPPR